jgi:hypothetical protein
MNTKKSKAAWGVLITFVVILAAATIFLGYETYTQYHQKEQLTASITQERQATQDYINSSFQKIEDNLAKIREHEGVLQKGFTDKELAGVTSPEERIQKEIDIIQKLMQENRDMISQLNSTVDSQNKQLAGYKRSAGELKARLSLYKDQMASLTAKNDSLVDNLAMVQKQNEEMQSTIENKDTELQMNAQTIDQQKQKLDQQEQQIYTGYYAVGTYKKLKEESIVDKEGGVFGIAATKTLADNFSTDHFRKVDIRDIQTIPVYAKKVDIITNHPQGSYELVNNSDEVEYIKITDPEQFWARSRYLVVVTNKVNNSELSAQLVQQQ